MDDKEALCPAGVISRPSKKRGKEDAKSFIVTWGGASLGTRPSKNRKGGSGTSAGVEVYTAEC